MPECSFAFCGATRNLHKFPCDPDLRAQWTNFCFRQANWLPGPGARICREHFTPNSYSTQPNSLVARLKKDAVPSIRGRRGIERHGSSVEAARKRVYTPLSENPTGRMQQQNYEQQQPLRTAAPALDPLQHQPPAVCATDVFHDHDYVSREQQVKRICLEQC